MNSQTLARYLHTIRHLRASQVLARVRRHWQSRHVEIGAAGPRRTRVTELVAPVSGACSMLAPNRFRFLNVERECASAAGWQGTEDARLWFYNLHYFDDLNAEGAAQRRDWHLSLLDRWRVENPPGHDVGWEPYPVARRMVNWIKFDLGTDALTADAVHSLAVQARWLYARLEYHLMGNHLFADAKALVFAGLYFDGDEARGWLERGMELVNGQIAEQVLADGGHFELSPMYHAAFLEDLLDLVNLRRSYGMSVDAEWFETVESMRRWLASMLHPDGQISFFNDAAFAVAPSAAELEAYSGRLGLPGLSLLDAGCTDLRASGYVRAESGPACLLCDCAAIGPDHLPGHAHADTLSFELSLFGQRVLVNGGTSTYGSDVERQRQRGSSAHNTIVLDGQDSSEVWGGFRVARRARIVSREVHHQSGVTRIAASHDGYRRLPGRNIHSRRWTLDPQALLIEDEISGGCNLAEARFHLHPAVRANMADATTFCLTTPGGGTVRLGISGAEAVALEPSAWHPEFGTAVPGHCVVARFTRGQLRTRVTRLAR